MKPEVIQRLVDAGVDPTVAYLFIAQKRMERHEARMEKRIDGLSRAMRVELSSMWSMLDSKSSPKVRKSVPKGYRGSFNFGRKRDVFEQIQLNHARLGYRA